MNIRNLKFAQFHYITFLGLTTAYFTRMYAVDYSNFYKNATKKQL